jgi:type VI secretion system secreted protein Hcp
MENAGKEQVYTKGYRMSASRNHLGRNILATASIVMAVVALGEVARSGSGPVTTAAAGGSGGTPAASSFFDIFLDIPGIPGESTTVGHVGSIEVESWSWGVSQTSTASAGGGGALAGQVKGHVTLIKRIDAATPSLLVRCSTGMSIPSATVQLVRTDGQTYLKYELKNVMVTAITHADTNGDGTPDEKIDLDLGGGTLTYTQFDTAGKAIGQTSAQW